MSTDLRMNSLLGHAYQIAWLDYPLRSTLGTSRRSFHGLPACKYVATLAAASGSNEDLLPFALDRAGYVLNVFVDD